MWNEHLASRIDRELYTDDRLGDQNQSDQDQGDQDQGEQDQQNNQENYFDNHDVLGDSKDGFDDLVYNFDENYVNLDDHVLDALHQLDGVNVVRLQVLQEGAQGPLVSLKRHFL